MVLSRVSRIRCHPPPRRRSRGRAGVRGRLGGGRPRRRARPPAAVPRADCGPGSRPETSIQGRVPEGRLRVRRAERGYLCNTRQVAHQGTSGGFKTLRYTDSKGNTCAFYDSTLLVGRDVVVEPAVRRRPRRRGPGHERPASSPQKTANLDLAGDAHAARVAARQQEARPAGRGDGHRRDAARRARRLRREDRLPPPEAAVDDGVEPVRPRERVLAATARRSTPPARRLASRPSTSRTRASRGRSSSSSGSSTTGCGSPTTAAPCTPPTSASPDRARLTGRRPADPGRQRHPGAEAEPEGDDRSRRSSWAGGSIPQVAEPFTRDGHQYLLEVDEFVDLFTVRA